MEDDESPTRDCWEVGMREGAIDFIFVEAALAGDIARGEVKRRS